MTHAARVGRERAARRKKFAEKKRPSDKPKSSSSIIRLGRRKEDRPKKKFASVKSQIERAKKFKSPIARAISSPKTTLALAGTLATVATAGAAGGALTAGRVALGAGRPGIVKAAAAGRLGSITVTGARVGGTAQRAFVGKVGSGNVNKIFGAFKAKAPVAVRFGSNTKSITATKGILQKIGISQTGAAIFVTAAGTYPFAGFIKEEAIQVLGFAEKNARDNDNFELEADAITEQEEIMNKESDIIDKIPFVNVLRDLRTFFDAVRFKNVVSRKLLDDRIIQRETGETDDEKWDRIEREQDERIEERRIDDEAYYARIDEDKAKAKEEGRKDDEKYFARVRKEEAERKAKEREADNAFYAALRIEDDKRRAARLAENEKIFGDSGRSNLNFGLL